MDRKLLWGRQFLNPFAFTALEGDFSVLRELADEIRRQHRIVFAVIRVTSVRLGSRFLLGGAFHRRGLPGGHCHRINRSVAWLTLAANHLYTNELLLADS